MRRAVRLVGWIIAGLVASGGCGPAWAHREPSGHAVREGAIVIPGLSHGQMSVISANGAAILDLADRQIPTDSTMRRLQGFINLQRFACLWGAMPGSIEDETSPFNECAHAYLAATRALLLHLQEMPGDRAAVAALVAKVQTEMSAHDTALVLCRYGDEPFNTAEVIGPHWADIPTHAPTSATLGGAMAVGCGGWLTFRRRVSRTGKAAEEQV